MSTKNEIQTQINIINDGGANTAAEVRSVLGTNANSLLEAIYASPVEESHTVNSVTIPVTAGFEYQTKITKIGRRITIDLNVVNTSGGFLSGTIFQITNVSGNQYLSELSQVVNYNLYDNAGNIVITSISSSATETNIVLNTIPNNTSFKGIITYNAAN